MGIFLALLFLARCALPLRAQERSHVKAELIAEQDSVQPGKSFSVGLQLTMKDGWHTYWRNPGDSGLATSVAWKLPPGFTAAQAQWPFPQRFASTYGYADSAALLWDIKAPATLPEGAPVLLTAAVKWLECKELCVPGKAELTLRLPARSSPPRLDPAFAKARRRLPGRLGKGPFAGWTARAFRDDGRIRLRLVAPSSSAGFVAAKKKFDADFFPYEADVVAEIKDTTFRTDGRTLTIELPESTGKAATLSGVVVLKHQSRAVELSVPIERTAP